MSHTALPKRALRLLYWSHNYLLRNLQWIYVIRSVDCYHFCKSLCSRLIWSICNYFRQHLIVSNIYKAHCVHANGSIWFQPFLNRLITAVGNISAYHSDSTFTADKWYFINSNRLFFEIFLFAEKFLMEDTWTCESHQHFQVSGRTKKQYLLCTASMVQHVINICDIWKTVIEITFFSLLFVFSFIFCTEFMFHLSCYQNNEKPYIALINTFVCNSTTYFLFCQLYMMLF